MKARVFNKCSPCTSDPGLYSFHYDMFHGVIDKKTLTPTSCDVYRNTFFEPPVICPGPLLLVDSGLYRRLAEVVRVGIMAVNDAFLFHIPYELRRVPDYLDPVGHCIDEVMLAKDELLLRAGESALRRYVGIDPVTIGSLDATLQTEVRARDPYSNEFDTMELVHHQSLVEQLGIIATGFGYQVSEAVREIIEPHLLWPYFRLVTIDI